MQNIVEVALSFLPSSISNEWARRRALKRIGVILRTLPPDQWEAAVDAELAEISLTPRNALTTQLSELIAEVRAVKLISQRLVR